MNKERKIKEPETVITDHMGWYHDGYYCNCAACPYAVADIEGNQACYKEEYLSCDLNN